MGASSFLFPAPVAPFLLLQVAADRLAPIRILAAILLVGLLCGLIYVLRHLKNLNAEIRADDLVPAGRGPRNNMIFIACAVVFVVTCLLLFLIVKA